MKSQRLEQLFLKTIEYPPGLAREEFIESETAGDRPLRAELLRMLDYLAESDSSGFLEIPLLVQDPSLGRVGQAGSDPDEGFTELRSPK